MPDTPSQKPEDFPENEDMDPVGTPYPAQGSPLSTEVETDIPQDEEAKRVVQPAPQND